MTPSEKITMLRKMVMDGCVYNDYISPAKAGELLDQTATLADEVQALQSDLLTARCEAEELLKENTALRKLADAVGSYKEKAEQMAQATDKTFNWFFRDGLEYFDAILEAHEALTKKEDE